MEWVIFLLVLFSFFLCYSAKKTYFYIYSLLFPLFFKFFLFKFGFSLAYTILNAQILAFLGIFVINRVFQKYPKMFVYLFIYILYFLFISVVQSVSFLTRWNEYKTPFIMMIWALMLLEDIRKGNVAANILRKFFVCFVIFEILLGVLQYLIDPIGDFFRNVQYITKGGELTEVRDVLESGYMVGTLGGASNYSDFMASCFVILVFYFFSKKKMETRYWVLLASIVLAILFSGVRTPFLIVMIAGLIVTYKYQRHMFKPIFLIFLVLIIFGGGLNIGTVDSFSSFESGALFRTFSLFSYDSDTLKETSTFSLTICMIPYVLANPLIGSGLYHKGGYMLELWNRSLGDDISISDAQLAFLIAEIGLLGLIMYLWPFYRIIKEVGKEYANNNNYYIYFLLLLVMSIVDPGIMETNQLFLFFYSVVFWIDPIPSKNLINK